MKFPSGAPSKFIFITYRVAQIWQFIQAQEGRSKRNWTSNAEVFLGLDNLKVFLDQSYDEAFGTHHSRDEEELQRVHAEEANVPVG